MTVIEALIQGMIQGFTEFLPVSSSGHLSLFQYFTGNNGETGFAFSILLHAGTLIAVIVCFFKTICRFIYELGCLVRDIVTRRFNKRRMPPERRTLLFLIVSTIPLVLVLLLKDFVSQFSTDNDITVEGFCFIITSILLLTSSKYAHGRKNGASINGRDALLIGAAQVVATMPGISRSGSTISTGLLCGFERNYAVTYSFILGIPAVLGATIVELKDLGTSDISLPLSIGITGFLSAVVFGILSIKLVQWLVRGDKFKYFGYYTLALGVLVIAVGFIDRFAGFPIQHFFQAL